MADKHPKRPRDPNQLAKAIVDIATGQKSDSQPPGESGNSSAAEWARIGGLKGGRARATQLSEERRKEIAKAAAAARWKNKDQ
jgi:hypothetical protein